MFFIGCSKVTTQPEGSGGLKLTEFMAEKVQLEPNLVLVLFVGCICEGILLQSS
jgi:hypothetical protein